MVNFTQFHLSTVAITHPPTLSQVVGSCVGVPRTACIQLAGARVDKKDPVLQILETCALIADCCFWSQRCRQRGRMSYHRCRASLRCRKPRSLQLKWLPGDVKDLCTSSSFIFHFSPCRSQILKSKTFKNNGTYEENQKVTARAQEKSQKRHKKTLSLHLMLIISTETIYNNDNNNKNPKTMTKNSNPEEGRESDFQSYHFIRFECPVQQQKSLQGIQRNGKAWTIQRKTNNSIVCLSKRLNGWYIRQKL